MPNNPISQNLPLQETSSTPLIIFVALLWTPSNTSRFFLCRAPHIWMQNSRWALMRTFHSCPSSSMCWAIPVSLHDTNQSLNGKKWGQ